MRLRNPGVYRELAHGDPTGTSITEKVRLDPATKQRVLHYLESAPILAASQLVFTDYFTGEVAGRLHLHTDGQWQWYSDLPYYVRTYDSVLDPEFLRAIEGRTEAQVSPEELLRISDDLVSSAQSGRAQAIGEDSAFLEEAQQIASGYFARLGYDASVEHRLVEGVDAYRFFQAVRGGAAIIVARDGSFLFANSSVPPATHEEAFLAGRRTDPQVFER
jgi:hypothetical protein